MVDQLFQNPTDWVGRALPDGCAVEFVLDGPGGGTWTMRNEEGAVAVVAGAAEEFDCRLTCTVEDFTALLNGELDALRGFRDGRLAVEGDVGLVLGLRQALAAR